jgi:hypothetical protein
LKFAEVDYKIKLRNFSCKEFAITCSNPYFFKFVYFVNGSDVSAKLRVLAFQYSSEGGHKQTFSLLRSTFLEAAIVCNLNDREKRNIQNEK